MGYGSHPAAIPHTTVNQDGADQMQQLIAEVDLLLAQATTGVEHRGLMRLRVMAERCAQEQGEL